MQPNKSLETLIIGAGGHARVVASILLAQNTLIKGFVDEFSSKTKKEQILGYPLLGSNGYIDQFQIFNVNLVLGIGDNAKRKKIYLYYKKNNSCPQLYIPQRTWNI